MNRGDEKTLNAANTYTNNRVNELSQQIGEVRKEALQGVAAAMALNIQMPATPGKGAIGVGVATYGGYSAIALAARKFSSDGKYTYGGGVTYGGGRVGVSASAAIGF